MVVIVADNVRILDTAGLQQLLLQLERKHHMSSFEFFSRFETGELDDEQFDGEFVRWANLWKRAVREESWNRSSFQS